MAFCFVYVCSFYMSKSDILHTSSGSNSWAVFIFATVDLMI